MPSKVNVEVVVEEVGAAGDLRPDFRPLVNSPPANLTLREIRLRTMRLPVLDQRSDDELLGYDERGTFGT